MIVTLSTIAQKPKQIAHISIEKQILINILKQYFCDMTFSNCLIKEIPLLCVFQFKVQGVWAALPQVEHGVASGASCLLVLPLLEALEAFLHPDQPSVRTENRNNQLDLNNTNVKS